MDDKGKHNTEKPMTRTIKCQACESENVQLFEDSIGDGLRCRECGAVFRPSECAKNATAAFPQASEPNEFRFLSPKWLNEIATGLTTGAKEHPGETWRTIPATEHAWRAIRHLIMFLMGDQNEPHLINASMRVMMAYETAKEKQHEHR